MKSHGATRTFGILASGGDCPGLNSLIRGVAEAATNRYNMNIIAFVNGYRGFIAGEAHTLRSGEFGTIAIPDGSPIDTGLDSHERSLAVEDAYVGARETEAVVDTYRRFQLDSLVVIGGYDALKTAYVLSARGLHVVFVPKTINNNIWRTDLTYGFYSAAEIAAEAIERLHTTARSHNRIMVIEVMGHTTGWLALHSGIAAGADVILIPEIPYRVEVIHRHLDARAQRGRHFSIMVAAEGAADAATAQNGRRRALRSSSIAYQLAEQLQRAAGMEARANVLGYQQRGGRPAAYDSILAARFGATVAEMLHRGDFGSMVALSGNRTVHYPLGHVAGTLRKVPPDHDLLVAARATGTCVGDED